MLGCFFKSWTSGDCRVIRPCLYHTWTTWERKDLYIWLYTYSGWSDLVFIDKGPWRLKHKTSQEYLTSSWWWWTFVFIYRNTRRLTLTRRLRFVHYYKWNVRKGKKNMFDSDALKCDKTNLVYSVLQSVFQRKNRVREREVVCERILFWGVCK